MGERTPLLGRDLERTPGGKIQFSESTEDCDPLSRRQISWDDSIASVGARDVKDVYVRVRPKSAPPLRHSAESDDSDDGWTQSWKRRRPQTSLDERTAIDPDEICRILNRQRSGGSEDEVFLDKEANKGKVTAKVQVMNLVLLNIIQIIWTIANHMHAPVYSQYLYRRILDEVLGNSTLPSGHNSSTLNATECYRPSSNENDSNSNSGYSLQEEAQKLASQMNMYFSLVGCAFSLVSTILFGAYSDYFGRKMLFLLPLIGHLIDYILVTITIQWSLDIRIFFLTAVLTGVCTSEIFAIACSAFVADNTPPEGSRTVALLVTAITESLTGATLSTGVGYYIQLQGFVLPSLTAAAILLLNILAVVFILPGKRKVAAASKLRKKKLEERKILTPLKAVRNVFSFYFFEGTVKLRVMFSLALVAYFLHEIAGKTGNIGTLWEMNYPFCWSPEMMGYYSTASSIFAEVIKLPLLKLFQCCFNDRFIAIWSNIAYTGGIVLKAFAYDNFMMYGVAFISAFDLSVSTIIKSMVSSMAGADRQGAVFSSLAIANIITSITGTPMFSEIYKYTLDIFKGVTYLVSAGLQCTATICLIGFAVLGKMGYMQQTEIINIQDNKEPTPSTSTAAEEDSKV
ncbi:lysosomal proton-coupled steroid conjugate and bile acid symporter SLC46A3-like [Haliotis cracherodii]|uniref:lysosomal proton-coupled steroid conjugate and bile acid symporter SLC46A3-like n=1 Tax=Haliotis cracherodii TaxID=6455 RepID=UPI0039EA5BCB